MINELEHYQVNLNYINITRKLKMIYFLNPHQTCPIQVANNEWTNLFYICNHMQIYLRRI